MADEAFLTSLSPADALRYKAFISSSFSQREVSALLGDALPPAHLFADARAHERLLLALCTAAKVFTVELAEAAMELRAADAGAAGAPLAPGHLQEAWRRRMLRGEVVGCGGEGAPSAGAVREAVAQHLSAPPSAGAGGGSAPSGK
jgi:hypothetical protein